MAGGFYSGSGHVFKPVSNVLFWHIVMKAKSTLMVKKIALWGYFSKEYATCTALYMSCLLHLGQAQSVMSQQMFWNMMENTWLGLFQSENGVQTTPFLQTVHWALCLVLVDVHFKKICICCCYLKETKLQIVVFNTHFAVFVSAETSPCFNITDFGSSYTLFTS